MYKKVLAGLAILALLATVLAACSIRDTAGGPTGPTVHMGGANFIETSITISKGESISLVNNLAVEHIITNGQWKGSVPAPAKESGAPVYNTTFISIETQTLGPFTTSGIFHYFCTVHPGMGLVVTVN